MGELEALFYAKGDRVYRRPVRTPRADGGHSVSMGFLVCEVAPGVDAEEVAAILDKGDDGERGE